MSSSDRWWHDHQNEQNFKPGIWWCRHHQVMVWNRKRCCHYIGIYIRLFVNNNAQLPKVITTDEVFRSGEEIRRVMWFQFKNISINFEKLETFRLFSIRFQLPSPIATGRKGEAGTATELFWRNIKGIKARDLLFPELLNTRSGGSGI